LSLRLEPFVFRHFDDGQEPLNLVERGQPGGDFEQRGAAEIENAFADGLTANGGCALAT